MYSELIIISLLGVFLCAKMSQNWLLLMSPLKVNVSLLYEKAMYCLATNLQAFYCRGQKIHPAFPLFVVAWVL